jgi:hypothetical protein
MGPAAFAFEEPVFIAADNRLALIASCLAKANSMGKVDEKLRMWSMLRRAFAFQLSDS